MFIQAKDISNCYLILFAHTHHPRCLILSVCPSVRASRSTGWLAETIRHASTDSQTKQAQGQESDSAYCQFCALGSDTAHFQFSPFLVFQFLLPLQRATEKGRAFTANGHLFNPKRACIYYTMAPQQKGPHLQHKRPYS